MADNAKDLFESAPDADQLFEAGEDVVSEQQTQASGLEKILTENPTALTSGITMPMAAGLYGLKKAGSLVGLTDEPEFVDELQTASDFEEAARRGLTLNSIDEIRSGVKAAVQAPFVDETLPELYRKYQDIEKQKKEEQQARSPIASTTGELAGGVALGMAMPTVGIESQVAKLTGSKTLTEANKAIKAAEGMGKLGTAVKEYGKIVPGLAAEGAAIGAVEGAMRADQGEVLEKAKEGAKFGGILSPAIGVGLGATSYTAESGFDALMRKIGSWKQSDSPVIAQTAMAMEQGMQNRIVSEGFQNKSAALKEESDAVNEMTSRLFEGQKQAGEGMSKALRQAAESGQKISIEGDVIGLVDDFIEINKSNPLFVTSKDSNKFINLLNHLKSGQLNPLQTKELVDMIDGLSRTTNDPRIAKAGFDFSKSLRDQLKDSVPGFKEANDAFKEISDVGEIILNKGYNPEFSGKSITQLKDKEHQVEKAVYEFLSKLGLRGGVGEDSVATLNYLKDYLQDKPELLKKIGFDNYDMFERYIREKGNAAAVKKYILGTVPQGGGSGASTAVQVGREVLQGASTTGVGMAYSAAQRIGQGISKVKPMAMGKVDVNITDDMAKVVKAPKGGVYTLTAPELSNIANKLKDNVDNPILRSYGEQLEQALRNNDTGKRNKILFLMQQNPSLRNMVSGEDNE